MFVPSITNPCASSVSKILKTAIHFTASLPLPLMSASFLIIPLLPCLFSWLLPYVSFLIHSFASFLTILSSFWCLLPFTSHLSTTSLPLLMSLVSITPSPVVCIPFLFKDAVPPSCTFLSPLYCKTILPSRIITPHSITAHILFSLFPSLSCTFHPRVSYVPNPSLHTPVRSPAPFTFPHPLVLVHIVPAPPFLPLLGWKNWQQSVYALLSGLVGV